MQQMQGCSVHGRLGFFDCGRPAGPRLTAATPAGRHASAWFDALALGASGAARGAEARWTVWLAREHHEHLLTAYLAAAFGPAFASIDPTLARSGAAAFAE